MTKFKYFITVAEVAKKYNKKPRGITDNLNRGAIKGQKVGRDWLVSVCSADSFYNKDTNLKNSICASNQGLPCKKN